MLTHYCYEVYDITEQFIVHGVDADERLLCGQARTPHWRTRGGGFSETWDAELPLTVLTLEGLAARVEGRICWACAQATRKESQ